jgi:large subunit ribosomal protein L3
MLNTILGSKGKMTSTFVEDVRVPVTRVTSGPCIVTQIRNEAKDGYWAIQLGFGSRKVKNLTKPQIGHLKEIIKDQKAPRYLREVRLTKEPTFKVGDTINASDVFKKGDVIAVTGTSKGKGFAGAVKRWHFAGGPKTHGQSDRQRAPGSIGQGTTPGRVLKNKHMAGRMGGDTVTTKNLHVVGVDPEKNEILISGAVPGRVGGLIIITRLHAGKLSEMIEETPQVVVQGEEPEKSQEVAADQAPVEAKEETPVIAEEVKVEGEN